MTECRLAYRRSCQTVKETVRTDLPGLFHQFAETQMCDMSSILASICHGHWWWGNRRAKNCTCKCGFQDGSARDKWGQARVLTGILQAINDHASMSGFCELDRASKQHTERSMPQPFRTFLESTSSHSLEGLNCVSFQATKGFIINSCLRSHHVSIQAFFEERKDAGLEASCLPPPSTLASFPACLHQARRSPSAGMLSPPTPSPLAPGSVGFLLRAC